MNHLNKHLIPAESTAFLNFQDDDGIQIASCPEGIKLVLDESVPYPDNKPHQELSRLLLPQAVEDEGRVLVLPPNFVTMTNALNDAIGDNTSRKSKDIMTDLFSEVARGLAQVAMRDGIVPVSVGYKNIIFSREAAGAKLLPPIEFVEFSPINKDQAQLHVVGSFRDSLKNGAANTTQRRHSMAVFKGFTNNFSW